jgi:hypothetical protein
VFLFWEGFYLMLEIIEQSYQLEMNAARLYTLFADLFEEDHQFWEQLAKEEVNHATLVTKCKNFPDSDLPKELLADSFEELEEVNARMDELYEQFAKTPPSRKEAFKVATQIERSAGEIHFQEFMQGNAGLWLGDVFRDLNADNKDHAKRIAAYAEDNGVF